LNVDSCKASQISGITDEFINLQTLSMTNNELTSLKGFPKLPMLRKVHFVLWTYRISAEQNLYFRPP